MRYPNIPTSTYRLQFSQKFRFADAMAVIPYLAELGIDTLYASPYFKARPGSMHGYDVTDHNQLNPEIGTRQEHTAMIALAQSHGMGHLLDFVPNHMGIGESNAWWNDILLWGMKSPYAHYFDINWQPLKPELQGKILLPVLGDHYGLVLERGELVLDYQPENSGFVVRYFDKVFPIRMESYSRILTWIAESPDLADPELQESIQRAIANVREHGEEREKADFLQLALRDLFALPPFQHALQQALAAARVTSEKLNVADRLDDLLGSQHYRLASWRLARDEINYRRFFDVNDLAGLCVEHIDVLLEIHRQLFEWIQDGVVQGVRIDHIDGLLDPSSYCHILSHQHLPEGQPLYIVVEKILARYESLVRDWEIAGTTGYEFSACVSGIGVNGQVEERFTRIYQAFSGLERDFLKITQEAKRLVVRTMLASELNVLAIMLERIAACDRSSVDFTLMVLRDALTEVLVGFPVYRTYSLGVEPGDKDIEYISWAVKVAKKNSGVQDEKVYEFIFDVLTSRILTFGRRYNSKDIIAFVRKFQQFTSPVMAKSVEDTSFYRYVRLLSLNEVGSDPSRFGVSVFEFHRFCSDRASLYPHALSSTATHDHKRGEDVRTRLNALTEMPELWRKSLSTFQRFSRRSKATVDGVPAPSANDEYALYQTLLGTWPCEWLESVPKEATEREHYAARIEAYLRKFMREAKLRSSWMSPDEAYEKATIDFARRLLDPVRSVSFQRTFLALAQQTARIGMLASLVQLALKLLAPGVPDCYQGCEYWDLTLVDPDNRGAVDFALRRRTLEEFTLRLQKELPAEIISELLGRWHDGDIKFFVLWRLLHIRRQHRDVFLSDQYRPLAVSGRRKRHVIAFARKDLVIVVPRLLRRLIGEGMGIQVVFTEGAVMLPKASGRYVDMLTGEFHDVEAGRLRLSGLFTILPIAVLKPLVE